MKYLRAVRGVTIMDRIRNTIIREELEIESTLKFVKKRHLSWFRHLQWMHEGRPAKRIWNSKPTGRRIPGRPKATWLKH